MLKTLEFTYGDGKLALDFPEDFLAGDVVRPKPSKAKSTERELEAMIDDALAHPHDSPRLKDMVEGKSVALVISDEFRAGLQRLILDRMLVEIHAGRPSKIGVFVATGSHDPKYYAKNITDWFNRSCEFHGIRAELFANECDSGEHVYLGDTSLGSPVEFWDKFMEYEVRAYGHESKHHYMNGYSVIDKQVMPGISSRKTIAACHKFALESDYSLAGRHPFHADPNRQRNPFAQGATDARHLSEKLILKDGKLQKADLPIFALDMISTKTSIDWILAGNPDEVCRRMTAAADELAAFELPRMPYVVISPGGPPACNALYGVQNCFDMALKGAIQPGGEALILAPCSGRPDLPEEVRGLAPDGKSKKLFWDNLCCFLQQPLDDALKHIDENFELYLWKTDRVLKLMRKEGVRMHLFSNLPPEVVEKGGFTPVENPQAWIDERAARGDGLCRAVDDGNKMLILGE